MIDQAYELKIEYENYIELAHPQVLNDFVKQSLLDTDNQSLDEVQNTLCYMDEF